MKKLISKSATLLLCCSIFILCSCSKDNPVEKKTVTVKYRILVSAAVDYKAGSNGGGIEELYLYTNKEMEAVSKAHDKETWTITETADTEKAAITACDKKAIAVFDAKLSEINAASESVKAKFDSKKAELLSKITIESSNAHIYYNGYGGVLLKGEVEDLFPRNVIKEGTLFDLKAVGGEKQAIYINWH